MLKYDLKHFRMDKNIDQKNSQHFLDHPLDHT